MKLNDAIFGALLLALGVAVLVIVQSYPKIPGQQVGPALFPGIIALALCVCGAALVVRGWRDRVTVNWITMGEWVRSPHHVVAFITVIASVVFYMLASEKLGFIITSTLSLTALMWALRVPPLRPLTIALIATLLIHLAFYKGLRVPLPWGVLTNYAWY